MIRLAGPAPADHPRRYRSRGGFFPEDEEPVLSRPPPPPFDAQSAITEVRLAEDGLMRYRHSSINALPIAESDREFHWPLGRRPDDHPGLSHFGF